MDRAEGDREGECGQKRCTFGRKKDARGEKIGEGVEVSGRAIDSESARLTRKKARPFSGEAAVRRESEVWIGPAQRANAMPCMGKII